MSFDYGFSWTRWCLGLEYFSDKDSGGYFTLWLLTLRATVFWRA